MDKSKLESLLHLHATPLARFLSINHWNIRCYAEACELVGASAECIRNVDYEFATIRVDPEKFDTEEEFLDSLFHEMCHIILSPIDLYREAATQHIEAGSVPQKQDERLWHFAIENTVINLERLWRWGGLREQYLERFTAG